MATRWTLRAEESIKNGSEPFLVWFADNLCALNLMDLVSRFHTLNVNLESGKEVTGILVTRRHRYEETGRVTVAANDCNKIEKFIEKPNAELESAEALGIYLFNNKVFEYLHQQQDSIARNKQSNKLLICRMMSGPPSLDRVLIFILTVWTPTQIG